MTAANDMEFFHQATNRICGSLDIDIVLSECLSFFEAYFPIDSISMAIIRKESRKSVKIASTQRDGVTHKLPQKIVYDRTAMELIEKDRDEPVALINDMAKDPTCASVVQAMGYPDLSMLVLKLNSAGNLVGTVNIMANGLNRFNREHARLLALLHDPFTVALSNTLKHFELTRLKNSLADDNLYLKSEIRQMAGDKIIGQDNGLKDVMEMVRQVAPLSSQVLILGETGVGKEVIANAIHYSSPRAKGPFIKVNCGAIPDSLIDSELFGHEQGAFTGATAKKRGRFERAHKGTIFLDEIGELPPQAQIRLLRVLQSREIERVGGNRPISLDIRIIAATHRDLAELVKKGQFREDLWFRLNVFPITIPPLRHRKMDIPAMIEYFITKKSKEMNLHTSLSASAETLQKLQNYRWPGNVRELENVVERALIHNTFSNSIELQCSYDERQENHISEPTNEKAGVDKPKNLNLDDAMKRHIEYALKKTRFRLYGEDGAAAALGINPSTLRHRMDKLGIRYKKTKRGNSGVESSADNWE